MADILAGRGFLSNLGSVLPGLSSPLAAFFASLLASSFGANFMWLGTHWILRLNTPFVHGRSVCLCCFAFLNSGVFEFYLVFLAVSPLLCVSG